MFICFSPSLSVCLSVCPPSLSFLISLFLFFLSFSLVCVCLLREMGKGCKGKGVGGVGVGGMQNAYLCGFSSKTHINYEGCQH